MTLTPEQQSELARLKAYFPYRVVYGAISPQGEFACSAVTSRRIPNKLAREGWQVWIARSAS